MCNTDLTQYAPFVPTFFSKFYTLCEECSQSAIMSLNFSVNLEIFMNFVFGNSAKRHIWHIQNPRLRHDLPTSVNDREI